VRPNLEQMLVRAEEVGAAYEVQGRRAVALGPPPVASTAWHSSTAIRPRDPALAGRRLARSGARLGIGVWGAHFARRERGSRFADPRRRGRGRAGAPRRSEEPLPGGSLDGGAGSDRRILSDEGLSELVRRARLQASCRLVARLAGAAQYERTRHRRSERSRLRHPRSRHTRPERPVREARRRRRRKDSLEPRSVESDLESHPGDRWQSLGLVLGREHSPRRPGRSVVGNASVSS
jgi:hypothetical protein